MSSLSQNDIAKRARERLTDWPEAKAGYTVPRLETMVNGALRRLAELIAADPMRRDLLRPTGATPYTSTLVAGQVDLAADITNNALLFERLGQAEIYMADLTVNAEPFQWVRNVGELSMRRISDAMFIHCCLQDTILRTRNADGALDTLDGDITYSANFIPSMTTLPQELEQPLVDVVADMALAGFKAGGQ